MVAYRKLTEVPPEKTQRTALSHDLFHGVTPRQLDREARDLASAEAMTPQVRARLEAQLIERLKTPVDTPSWGPDWVKQGERHAPRRHRARSGLLGLLSRRREAKAEEESSPPLSREQLDDAQIISRNLEKSRQLHHYRWLYVAALCLALGIALLAMFVDYNIIRGDVWTRALSNEFMEVPASLQSSVVFKSLQVVFAVLIVHFMLKITGVYGRNTLIVAAFVLALVMIGSLGYLVAYNNMAGATSATSETHDADALPDRSNAIDNLFASDNAKKPDSALVQASLPGSETSSLSVPRISEKSLANADGWLWLLFASVIFFIVTTVAALYMQTVENNVRNFAIAGDYKHRKKHFTQLHLLELADRRQGMNSQGRPA